MFVKEGEREEAGREGTNRHVNADGLSEAWPQRPLQPLLQVRGHCTLYPEPYHTGQVNLEEVGRSPAISPEALLPRWAWRRPPVSLHFAHICFGSLAPAPTSLEKGDPSHSCSVYQGLSDTTHLACCTLPSSGVSPCWNGSGLGNTCLTSRIFAL